MTLPYGTAVCAVCHSFFIGVGRGGGARGGQFERGGANIPFGPPNNPPTFSLNFYVKQEKITNDHKCTKLKGKIIINVTIT